MASNWLDYFTLNNIGFVIGVLGFLFSIYTYLRTRERRAMLYEKMETRIVGGNGSKILDGKIEIRFSGRTIERVTKTRSGCGTAGTEQSRPKTSLKAIHCASQCLTSARF